MGFTYSNETECPRVFDCKNCGTRVMVYCRADHRTVFCCEHCEKDYWKHHAERERRKKTSRGHVTTLGRERRENMREAGL